MRLFQRHAAEHRTDHLIQCSLGNPLVHRRPAHQKHIVHGSHRSQQTRLMHPDTHRQHTREQRLDNLHRHTLVELVVEAITHRFDHQIRQW